MIEKKINAIPQSRRKNVIREDQMGNQDDDWTSFSVDKRQHPRIIGGCSKNQEKWHDLHKNGKQSMACMWGIHSPAAIPAPTKLFPMFMELVTFTALFALDKRSAALVRHRVTMSGPVAPVTFWL
jgi:hypothetical protein